MAFQCPRCETVSPNPNDEAQRYCVRCHLFFQEDGNPETPTPEEWTEIERIGDRRRELMKTQPTCDACGSAQMQLISFPNVTTHKREDWVLWKCRMCNWNALLTDTGGRWKLRL